MLSERKRISINQRLILIRLLLGVRDNFRGKELFDSNNGHHPYTDYSALIQYLALTCFDILGQPCEWMTFGSWLEVKDSKYSNLIFERDKILKQHEDYEKHVFAKKAWDSYNKHFSVRNSFFRFLRNVITDDDRNQLFHSIKVYEKPKEESIEYNSATAVEVDLNIKEKEEFLFRIRNNFTHNGISNSDMLGGIMMSIDISKPTLINGKEIWAQVDTELFKEKGKEKYLFSVVKWPYILIEIIENSLQRL